MRAAPIRGKPRCLTVDSSRSEGMRPEGKGTSRAHPYSVHALPWHLSKGEGRICDSAPLHDRSDPGTPGKRPLRGNRQAVAGKFGHASHMH
ncbi:unnamed protein product [Calypogeia fissa]